MLCVDVCRFTDTKNFELILIINRLGSDGHLVAKKKKKKKKRIGVMSLGLRIFWEGRFENSY